LGGQKNGKNADCKRGSIKKNEKEESRLTLVPRVSLQKSYSKNGQHVQYKPHKYMQYFSIWFW